MKNIIWIYGYPKSGKTSLALTLAEKMMGSMVFDQSEIGMLGDANAWRVFLNVVEVVASRHWVIATFETPKVSIRNRVREKFGEDVCLIHVRTSKAVCEQRGGPKSWGCEYDEFDFSDVPDIMVHGDMASINDLANNIWEELHATGHRRGNG